MISFTSPLNQAYLHIENHGLGPRSKLHTFSIDEIEKCHSITNHSRISLIWNRVLMFLKTGAWASNQSIERYFLTLNKWSCSKIADAIFKNTCIEQEVKDNVKRLCEKNEIRHQQIASITNDKMRQRIFDDYALTNNVLDSSQSDVYDTLRKDNLRVDKGLTTPDSNGKQVRSFQFSFSPHYYMNSEDNPETYFTDEKIKELMTEEFHYNC